MSMSVRSFLKAMAAARNGKLLWEQCNVKQDDNAIGAVSAECVQVENML